jgi:hypothetical protein
MKTKQLLIGIFGALFVLFPALLVPERVLAHCDTLDGPVVKEARAALETGDITPVLKWIRAEDEQEIRAAFTKTLSVRSKGADAQELADHYFFETLIRIHRAGEGAPYTGLKSADTVDPAVVLADKALENGNADTLISVLTGAMADGIRTRFQKAQTSKKNADENVEAGREFVHHYVIFTHYTEGLHSLIKGGAAHHGAGEQEKERGHDL